MKPRAQLIWVLCALCTLTLISSDAAAQFRRAGKMSGPGPYIGIGFFYPIPLYPTRYDVRTEVSQLSQANVDALLDAWLIRLPDLPWLKNFYDHNKHTGPIQLTKFEKDAFRSAGFEVAPIPTECRDFATAECLERVRVLAGFLRLEPGKPTDAEVNEIKRILEDEDWCEYLKWDQRKFFAQINARIALRPYTPGGVGLFEDSRFRKPYIPGGRTVPYATIAFDALWSYNNDLIYRGDPEETPGVTWLSIYPAIETRFPIHKTFSLAVNGGPALNYLSGDEFDNFLRGSARFRIGLTVWRFFVGYQLDYFWDRFVPTDFGAVGPIEARADDGEFINSWFVNFRIR